MIETNSFGEWLRHRRRELDLTQEELARQVGCARITIRKIEAEQLRPSKQMAELLSERLGVPRHERENFLRFARGGMESAPVTANPPRHNLPLLLTTFVGREREIAEVGRLLEAHRLVTLTGSGGTGKTRLALQVATEVLDQFPHGVWFVELAPIENPDLIVQVVLSVFGLSARLGREPLEALTDYLHTKSLVIILDNCEHLLDDCCRFTQTLLEAAPDLRVLATSREALGLAGEQAYRVPPMATPDLEHLPPTAQLTGFEAVHLFTERAALTVPSFSVTDGNARAVVQICHRLDGIPLAIELAAARLKSMSLDTVISRLDDCFRLLTGGSVTAMPRQQTLRATIDWSYDLLAEPEKLLLERLSVFRGGWTLEAAEAVCSGEGIEQATVLDLLSKLVDKSLVVLDEGDRYGIHEVVRQYAREKLLQSGQVDPLHERHGDYFIALAEQAEPELSGRNQLVWLDRLEAEVDNLRVALEWAQDRDPELFLRLASALWRFWDLHGYGAEGLNWLIKALAVTPDMRTRTRAMALAKAGHQARNLQDHKRSTQLEQEAFALALALGNKPALAMALAVQGYSAMDQNQPEAGLAFLARALGLARELGDHGRVGGLLVYMGIEAANRNDLIAARSLMEQGLEATRAEGDRRHITLALQELGYVAQAEGDSAKAKALFEEALALSEEIGDKTNIGSFTLDLAAVALLVEDYALAAQLLEQASNINEEIGDRYLAGVIKTASARLAWAQGKLAQVSAGLEEALMIAGPFDMAGLKAYALYYLGQLARAKKDWKMAARRFAESLPFFRLSDRGGYCLCLEGFAAVALETGQAARAARLYGARQKLRATTRAQDNYPFMVRERERLIAQTQAQLGEEAFNAAWVAGQAMSEEEMLEYALAQS